MKPPIFDPEWPEDIKILYRHDVEEIWDPTIAKHIYNKYHNQLDTYLSIVEGRNCLDILDIGCAQGTLALLLAELGHKVFALDIRKQFLSYAASRYEKGDFHPICGNAMEIDFNKKFDLIYANQIVEHLVHPLEFTQRIVKWLKPMGHLIMTTPNYSYVRNPHPSFSEIGDPAQYEDIQFFADGDGHFFSYRTEELKEIFEKVNLSDVKIHYFETPWISGNLKLRYLHNFLPVSVLKWLEKITLSVPGLAKRLSFQLMLEGTLVM